MVTLVKGEMEKTLSSEALIALLKEQGWSVKGEVIEDEAKTEAKPSRKKKGA